MTSFVITPDESPTSVLRSALDRDDPSDLLRLVIDVALDPPGRIQAEHFCLRLSGHWHPQVRGNAVLGLGHLARIYRYLNRRLAQPVIESALADAEFVVRQQAEEAANDVEWFLGWVLAGREERRHRAICPR